MKLKTVVASIFFLILFVLSTFNSEKVFALPQYCSYDQSSHKCCGGAAINCTDIDPDNPYNDKFCNGGVITPVGSACAY